MLSNLYASAVLEGIRVVLAGRWECSLGGMWDVMLLDKAGSALLRIGTFALVSYC